ncbi:type II toxin-antitoxin system RelE/ParE family toxin [Sphingomonas sanxanigenens]|uniref:Plasmid stabilization protein n=1 Tax=Sphingomonas sanxanigenens DSM 19645 = NX02 TaxID=1123269 RepID=W0AKP0_9SPHN|nr:type II toxin-antitoxin system RelE/ParE family toxin [Sphingomonas sanxanigenens]AHE56250.1 hypothetical protein NX02_23170 [Sphingomonas sanxanigenens DSM 19645 = NX02]
MSLPVYAPRADQDLRALFEMIGADDIDAAERFIGKIRRLILRLGDFPMSGPARPELGDGLRSLSIGAYVILYRVLADDVLIVRVVHSARDLPRILRDDA